MFLLSFLEKMQDKFLLLFLVVQVLVTMDNHVLLIFFE